MAMLGKGLASVLTVDAEIHSAEYIQTLLKRGVTLIYKQRQGWNGQAIHTMNEGWIGIGFTYVACALEKPCGVTFNQNYTYSSSSIR